jgi:hypothetical protein
LHGCAGKVQENWGFFKLFLTKNDMKNPTFDGIIEGKNQRGDFLFHRLKENLSGAGGRGALFF